MALKQYGVLKGKAINKLSGKVRVRIMKCI